MTIRTNLFDQIFGGGVGAAIFGEGGNTPERAKAVTKDQHRAMDDMGDYFEQDLAEQESKLSAGRLQARINNS